MQVPLILSRGGAGLKQIKKSYTSMGTALFHYFADINFDFILSALLE